MPWRARPGCVHHAPMRRWLLIALPLATPLVAAWARLHEARILRLGAPLGAAGQAVARSVGVARPDRIRVLRVRRVPVPFARLLAALARRAGLPGPDVDGMTLGHGIYLRGTHDTRLLAHECRHVAQAEAAGSTSAFIAAYLREVARHGYHAAPMEVDARRAAAHHNRPGALDAPDRLDARRTGSVCDTILATGASNTSNDPAEGPSP